MLAVDSGFTNADIVAIFVGVVAVVLSVIALIVAAKQYNVGEIQTTLTKRQADIAETQHKIAQEQHDLLMQQVQQRGQLVMVFEPLTMQHEGSVAFNVDLYLRNEGWLRVDDCTWSIFGHFEDIIDTDARRNMGEEIEGTHKMGWTGHYAGTVSRHEFKKVGTLRVRKRFVREKPVQFWWFIDTPTQRFPEGRQFGAFTLTIDMIKPMYRWDSGVPPQS